MYRITFDEIMEYYPVHNRSVFDDIVNSCRERNLIPFVGAGLSVFCGYSQWPALIKELSKSVYDATAKAQIDACIAKGELLEAAQLIYDNYRRLLRELQKKVPFNKVEKCRKDMPQRWYTSAAYVLPYLFSDSMVMTTNYDRVLQTVFEDHKSNFDNVISPMDQDLLQQARQKNLHCLFKLHGDIGKETISADRIVFSAKQYETYYNANGPLVKELTRWFEDKQMLFLGCSLDKDQTIEVLHTAASSNSSVQHFAILACKKEDIPRRNDELCDLGIDAIFYPDGKHDAVRVILERILEEVAPKDYAQLAEICTVYAENPKRPLTYDSNFIEFSGREAEMERLEAFCNSGEKALWWAVTGPGGMGKSRLLFELRKKLEQQHWQVIWPESRRYAKLAEIETGAGNVLVVVDDAQEYLKDLGDWMAREVERPRGGKLRMILLERDGKDPYSASWAESIRDEMEYGRPLEGCLYAKEFLQLERLSDDALKAIMSNYAKASGKPLKGEDHAQRLLDALEKLDKGLLRPLYAVAIADTWCSGKDPAMMARDEIMEDLVNRELRFYSDRLKNILGDAKKSIRAELEKLLVQSIVEAPLFLEEINTADYPKLSGAAGDEEKFNALIRDIGLVDRATVVRFVPNVSEENTDQELPAEPPKELVGQEKTVDLVRLNCPDLLKEYLVQRQTFHPREPNLKLLLSNGWQNRPERLMFIARLLHDYPEKLKEQKDFWTAFFAAEPTREFLAYIYGWCLFGITVEIPTMAKKAVERLAMLQEAYSKNEEIAERYAKGLVILFCEQQLPGCEDSVSKLRELQEAYPGNEEIALAYANGLWSLSAEQQLPECEESVSKLRALQEAYSGNEEIALAYASGLRNLSKEQQLSGREDSASKLKVLHESYPKNEEIACAYAWGLWNLSIEQQLPECEDSVSKLRGLHQKYPGNEGIAEVYARSFLPLSFKQINEESVQKSVKKVKELAERFTHNARFFQIYAMVKFNLTLKQERDDLQRTVEELRRELQDHPEANEGFQKELDTYLEKHPEHSERYLPLRV